MEAGRDKLEGRFTFLFSIYSGQSFFFRPTLVQYINIHITFLSPLYSVSWVSLPSLGQYWFDLLIHLKIL